MKGLLITGVITIVILFGGVILLSKGGGNPSQPVTVNQNIIVKSDSHQTKPGAKVTVVEFGDYQCPACGQAYPTVKQVKKDYGDKINFVFRNYPLSQHKFALIAAEAAEAANAQGKFWEMHDLLFENQTTWSIKDKPLDFFVGYAKDLGLDTNKFKKDVEDNKYATLIQGDINDGNSVAINATPTFFVNGQVLPGLPSYQDFKTLIDQDLAKN